MVDIAVTGRSRFGKIAIFDATKTDFLFFPPPSADQQVRVECGR